MPAAKWLLLIVLSWPLLELAAFIAVAAAIGFGLAFLALFSTSLIGAAVLRYAGGNHIARFRVAMNDAGMSGLQADGPGFLVIVAGFLLLLPGFISDVLGLLLLLPLTRRMVGGWFSRSMRAGTTQEPGVVELERDEWRQVPDEQIEHRRKDDRDR